MRSRRRRWFREETVAPWITLAVILGLWWTGARLVVPRHAKAFERPPAAQRRADAVPAVRDESHLAAERVTLSLDAREAPAVGAAVDDLLVPVAGVEPSALRTGFEEARGGGRRHEAIDILAPRGSAVYAAADGRIAKLFTSAAGGLTIYQFDPVEEYAFYYAHLDAYAANLTEGQAVVRGQTIGYVGTTGNAPPSTPHLHFAIFKLGPEKRWWEGVAIDPFPLLTRTD